MYNWLTLDGLARHLKMSRATLYKMAQKGEIPAVKLGRCWRFDQETIDQWLKNQKNPSQFSEFPWRDCLDTFVSRLKKELGNRFSSVWIYGSWARGEARPDSDIDLLVVMEPLQPEDWRKVSDLAYQSTFGRNRSVIFSAQVIDQKVFLTSLEPLLLNVRREGRKAA